MGETKIQVYENLLSVWIANENVDIIKKKTYKALEVLITGDGEFLNKMEDNICKEFFGNFTNCNSSSKKIRLEILLNLIKNTSNIEKYFNFIPEIIASYNEVNKDARDKAKTAIQAFATNESVNQEKLVNII